MSDLSQEVQTCFNIFKKYAQESEEYYTAIREKSHSGNYMEHTKRITLLDNRVKAGSREVRRSIQDYMDKLADAFKTLIDDMKGDRNIVGNPDQVLKFSSQMGENTRLSGKRVKDCFVIAYCYCLALAHRLDQGELYGTEVELTEDEYQKAFG